MSRIVLHGGGRMARQVADCAADHGSTVTAVISRSRPGWCEAYAFHASLDELPERPDAIIDFTLPGGTRAAARWARANLVALVSGTTALDAADREALQHASELVPVLWSPNLARGPNLLYQSVQNAARTLGEACGVRIVDVHHVHKQDAPSGTALWLAQAVATAWGTSPSGLIDRGDDVAAAPRPGRILCVSVREGEVIGTHRVRFFSEDEQLEFAHEALDRAIFARGSLDAADWLIQQPAGLYSGSDWLSG